MIERGESEMYAFHENGDWCYDAQCPKLHNYVALNAGPQYPKCNLPFTR